MHWLIFLSRVAFLSGMVMLVALSFSFTSWYHSETALQIIVLSGYGLAAILLPLINVIYLIMAIFYINNLIAPRWLIVSNIFLLIIFLIFTFYFNDPYYN